MTTYFPNRLTASLLLLLAVACTQEQSCCDGDEVTGGQSLSDQSIYQLDHAFQDQHNVTRHLADNRGHATLVAMIFTNCSYACPALVNDIKRTVDAVAPASSVRVVLVTMDAKRDQPNVLLQFAQDRELPDESYSLLHGDSDAIAEVAAVLGVRFSEVDGGDFSHSNQIVLLNQEGEIHYRLQGLGMDIAPLVAAIKQLQ